MRTVTTTTASLTPLPLDAARIGLTAAAIAQDYRDNLAYLLGRFPAVATTNDHYLALAYAVRDRILHRWIRTAETYYRQRSRSLCYLSAEFLIGPQLAGNLVNLGITESVREAMRQVGVDLETLVEQEEEPGLGNGGLGRLAACYMESLATLEIPTIGHGIRYEFGIFDQAIRNGWQVEMTDKWLRLGYPWEIARPEVSFDIMLGGHTESYRENDEYRVRWVPNRVVRGTPYDTPILGYRRNTVNLLRLWKAEAVESFDFEAFNRGNYYGAVMDKVTSENITKVLYPNDESLQGKQLRLEQQYFFSACAIQDMIRLYRQRSDNLDGLDQTFAVQLNDTHPAIAVAELMRLLVDEHHLGWDRAWRITTNVFGYTNHTLLPEALERWPIGLFGSVLPRHLEIIFEINRRLLDDVRAQFPGDDARLARMSLIDEQGERYVRMAHLACVGSHAINGVARLHTDLLKAGVLRDFHEMTPEKFSNKTNGVTPRRFLAVSNPRLAELITRHLSDDWVESLDQLRGLESLVGDPSFRSEWRAVKRANKLALAGVIQERTGVQVSADSLFDVHVKRLHEYKRQQLNILHVVSLYNRLRRTPEADGTPPRTVIFAGKAAPGYAMAKLIIKLIHCVADVVNHDSLIDGRLKVVFLPDFNVKNAQRIYPAADLSEQISTAGKEASGTGNMKFSMNGALTIGTLDGANIEIRDEVGHDNFFMFGLTAAEVQATKARGYDPVAYRNADDELAEALDQIQSGFFSPSEPALFHPLVDSLLSRDEYMVLADYRAYVDCQRRVEAAYRDAEQWTRMSILNVARMGYFSSDRAIREYCDEIWKLSPVPIDGPTT